MEKDTQRQYRTEINWLGKRENQGYEIDFTKLFNNSVYGKVYVTMPEFKCDFGEDLTEICKGLGIKTLFSSAADFSPMSNEWLKVDAIIHKAHIEVDRKGTKAAAVTMAVVVAGCAPCMDYKTVCLDRLFVYAIMNIDYLPLVIA